MFWDEFIWFHCFVMHVAQLLKLKFRVPLLKFATMFTSVWMLSQAIPEELLCPQKIILEHRITACLPVHSFYTVGGQEIFLECINNWITSDMRHSDLGRGSEHPVPHNYTSDKIFSLPFVTTYAIFVLGNVRYSPATTHSDIRGWFSFLC